MHLFSIRTSLAALPQAACHRKPGWVMSKTVPIHEKKGEQKETDKTPEQSGVWKRQVLFLRTCHTAQSLFNTVINSEGYNGAVPTPLLNGLQKPLLGL